jgi:predicted DNA-binding transcriptional regulator YafY
MTEDGKRRRLMSLKRVDRDIEHLVRLQEAIDKKHKVILRGYASGNSGEVRDRLVVPINLFYDDEKVWCFDLEDRQFKQFNLARIGRVDTDVPDPEYNHDFRPCQADVFSWVDKDRNYPIRLRMEVMAYNYLVEHFAGARHLPDTELYQEDDAHWILDTVVHGLGPLRWFYVMLADKIEILDSPAADALKEEVRKFVEKHLQ